VSVVLSGANQVTAASGLKPAPSRLGRPGLLPGAPGCDLVCHASLAHLRGDAVVAAATEGLELLDDEADFARQINMVMASAEEMTKDLVKRYGGTTRKRAGRKKA